MYLTYSMYSGIIMEVEKDSPFHFKSKNGKCESWPELYHRRYKMKRDIRINIKVTEDERAAITKVCSDRGMSLTETIVTLFNEEKEKRFDSAIAKASALLEGLKESGKANYFTISSIVGSIPRFSMSENEQEAFVYANTGKLLSMWKKDAESLVCDSGDVA